MGHMLVMAVQRSVPTEKCQHGSAAIGNDQCTFEKVSASGKDAPAEDGSATSSASKKGAHAAEGSARIRAHADESNRETIDRIGTESSATINACVKEDGPADGEVATPRPIRRGDLTESTATTSARKKGARAKEGKCDTIKDSGKGARAEDSPADGEVATSRPIRRCSATGSTATISASEKDAHAVIDSATTNAYEKDTHAVEGSATTSASDKHAHAGDNSATTNARDTSAHAEDNKQKELGGKHISSGSANDGRPDKLGDQVSDAAFNTCSKDTCVQFEIQSDKHEAVTLGAAEQWYENAAGDACPKAPDLTLDQARIFVRRAFKFERS